MQQGAFFCVLSMRKFSTLPSKCKTNQLSHGSLFGGQRVNTSWALCQHPPPSTFINVGRLTPKGFDMGVCIIETQRQCFSDREDKQLNLVMTSPIVCVAAGSNGWAGPHMQNNLGLCEFAYFPQIRGWATVNSMQINELSLDEAAWKLSEDSDCVYVSCCLFQSRDAVSDTALNHVSSWTLPLL